MGGFVRNLTGATQAARASEAAAATQAQYQDEALQYLKEAEELPQQFREGALTQLAGLAGLEGGEGSQQQLIDQARMSPLYQAIMGQRQAGEEAILRNQAVTGGLRSGASIGQLTDYGQQLENQALLQSYNQQLGQLQGLAQLPSNVNQIAAQQSGIGQTLAQGQVAAAQARQQGGLGALIQPATQLGAAYIMSDIRLKDNIKLIEPTSIDGISKYSWTWNEKSGKTGDDEGYLAQEVEQVFPELVVEGDDGYKRIHKEELEEILNNG